ncbi:response regulator [Candidatus Wolfebacteria bacterium]|nr:response regulator [Candidatus Wolfebacteria bacterium]
MDTQEKIKIRKAKRILIAEDERPLAKVLLLKLTKAGFEVVIVCNGEEALDKITTEKFDLILLDLVMPNISGFGVLTKMKELGNNTPVIVLSNLSQEGDEIKAKNLGAEDFFVKSNTPISEIVKHVQKTLAVGK